MHKQSRPIKTTRPSTLAKSTKTRNIQRLQKRNITSRVKKTLPSQKNTTTSLHGHSFMTTPFSTTRRTMQSKGSTFIPRDVDGIVENIRLPEGVGVYVRRSIGRTPRYFSPFALLDQFNLDANALERGIGFHPHPHRGMATFTYILPYEGNGSVTHKDHLGNHGDIGPGDIQYMAAGRGIVHSEMPTNNKAVSGLQLWINLPQKDKMMAPAYQEYKSDELPTVEKDGVHAKVIMGDAMGIHAKVKTQTPVHYIHYTLQPHKSIDHPLPPHWNTFLFILEGEGYFANEPMQCAKKHYSVFFKTGLESDNNNNNNNNGPDAGKNTGVTLTAGADGLECVLISGEPLPAHEGVVQHGPMVMNTREEIQQAFFDFKHEKNGFEGAQMFIDNWKM